MLNIFCLIFKKNERTKSCCVFIRLELQIEKKKSEHIIYILLTCHLNEKKMSTPLIQTKKVACTLNASVFFSISLRPISKTFNAHFSKSFSLKSLRLNTACLFFVYFSYRIKSY